MKRKVIVSSDEKASGIIHDAFKDIAEYDGIAYRFEPGFSRKQVLVPAIRDVLEKRNNHQN